MAAGGNGKALEYFKGNEMGKLSSSGRPVDYASNVAQRTEQRKGLSHLKTQRLSEGLNEMK